MQRQARKTRTKANALTSPIPQRVSMVRAGANQTPFDALKAEHVVVEQKELDAMVSKLKSDGYDVAAFAFKGENWNRAAVDGWLADGGYEGFTVEGEDGSYVVKSAEPVEGDAREITTTDGVTVSVVKAASTETIAEPEAAEGETNVQPVAADKGDFLAFSVDLIGRIKADPAPVESLKSLSEVYSMAELIRGLKWLCSDLNYEIVYGAGDATIDAARQAVIDQIKAAAQTMLSAFAALAQVEVSVIAEQFNAIKQEDAMSQPKDEAPAEAVAEETNAVVEAVKTDDEAPAAEDEAVPAAEEPAAEEPAAEEAPVEAAKTEDAPAWAQALVASVTEVTKSVETLAEQVKVVSEKQAAAETGTDGTAVSVQTRKSEDADDQAPGSESRTKDEQITEDRMQSLRLKGALGI